MKKYIRIYRRFIDNAVSYHAQYRKDTWLQVIVMIAWIAMLLLSIEIIFQHTNEIGGWEKQHLYLLTLLWTISYETSTLLFRRAMSDLPDVITDGNLDILLTRPVNNIFITTLHKVELRSLYTIALQLLGISWLCVHYDFALSFLHIILCIITLLCAIIAQFSIYLIANTFSFWFLRINNVNDAIWAIQGVGRYPLNIFPSIVSATFLLAIPVGLMGYVPISLLTGAWPIWAIILPLLISILLLTVAILFWYKAIRSYSSASS